MVGQGGRQSTAHWVELLPEALVVTAQVAQGELDGHSTFCSELEQLTQKLCGYPRASRKLDLPVLQQYRYYLICDPLRLRLPCGYGPPQARPLQMLSEVFIEDMRLCFLFLALQTYDTLSQGTSKFVTDSWS